VKASEVCQGLKVPKTGVTYTCAAQAKIDELGHIREVLQARVCDTGFADRQMLEFWKRGKMRESRVADWCAIQVQPFKFLALLQSLNAGISDFGVFEREIGQIGEGVQEFEIAIGNARIAIEGDFNNSAGPVGEYVGAELFEVLSRWLLIGIATGAAEQKYQQPKPMLHGLADRHAEEEFDVAASLLQFAEQQFHRLDRRHPGESAAQNDDLVVFVRVI
jgi:hypothetical protein